MHTFNWVFIHMKYSRLHYDFLLLKDCSFTFQCTLTNLIYKALPHATSSLSSNCTFKKLKYLFTAIALIRFKYHIISRVSRAQMILFHDDIEKNSTHNSKYVRASSSQPPTLQKCSYVISFFIHRCCSCVTILFSGSWPLQYQMGLLHLLV